MSGGDDSFSESLAIEKDLATIVSHLFRAHLIKFGSFQLRSGIESPVYIDLRQITLKPMLLKTVAALLEDVIEKQIAQRQLLCGIPYTALPIATLIAANLDAPMVLVRKEAAKKHGTMRKIECSFDERGQKVLLIDDVCSSGGSLLEMAKTFRDEGFVIENALVMIDRETGGREELEKAGIHLHHLLTLRQMCSILVEAKLISDGVQQQVSAFIESTRRQVIAPPLPIESGVENGVDYMRMSFEHRSSLAMHPTAARLFGLMATKKTNLAIAADFTDSDRVVKLANDLGPYICAFKVHADIIEKFDEQGTAGKLRYFADKHQFLLFEDRKFVDIGAVAQQQLEHGSHRIGQWADLITLTCMQGSDSIGAMKRARLRPSLGALLVAEMSNAGNRCQFQTEAAKDASEHQDFVVGFIAQSPIAAAGAEFVRMTPGIRSDTMVGDGLDQRYRSARSAVLQCGTDVVIVGRAITEEEDGERRAELAQRYQSEAFSAYLERIGRTTDAAAAANSTVEAMA